MTRSTDGIDEETHLCQGQDASPSDRQRNSTGRILRSSRTQERWRQQPKPHGRDLFKKAIGIAPLFWNVAMEPEDEQPERLREIARDLAEDAGNDPAIVQYVETLGAALLLRKKTLFPNVRRTILDYKAIGRREYIDLTVYSAPCPANPETDE